MTIPSHDADLDLWLPVPRTDADQRVLATSISSPVALSRGEDPVHHNDMLHGQLSPSSDELAVVVRHEIVQFTTGRDISLVPPQRTGPVDRFIFPHAEIADRRQDVGLRFSFRDIELHGEP